MTLFQTGVGGGGARDLGKPGFNHCSRINIEIREKQVRCNRELNRINKGLDVKERQHVRNMRKFDSAQRGVMLLIGESPYPDCVCYSKQTYSQYLIFKKGGSFIFGACECVCVCTTGCGRVCTDIGLY